jgi:microcystin-dependent protein
VSQPYVGEIRMFAGNFAPAGWMFCEGQLLPISENETLFNLIGTTYGGDGQATFALPDLRGRLPIHQGSGFILSQTGGVETVTLNVNQIPAHTHPFLASSDIANSPDPANSLVARSPQIKMFLNANASVTMSTQFLSNTGGDQPHSNFQPYLCVSFILSLFGVFPSQT